MNQCYYESFKLFWIPIYKKQYFKAKVQNDIFTILSIKENIWKNWHFSKMQRDSILAEIGITE